MPPASGHALSAQQWRVLLVEDEDVLRELAAENLQEAGYEVLEAGDGEGGLEALKSGEQIDVLLSDIRLPGMNGYELAEAGRMLRPGLKIILMTGYASGPMPSTLEHAVYRVLQKPFELDTLSDMIAAALEGKEPGSA
ncbi:MAG TPA: response regulator [Rhodanobacteraceae bacterium]|nr:response regulator [Rhodanobacteraceae bacterium]